MMGPRPEGNLSLKRGVDKNPKKPNPTSNSAKNSRRDFTKTNRPNKEIQGKRNTVATRKLSKMGRVMLGIANLTIDQLFNVMIRLIFMIKQKFLVITKSRRNRRSSVREAFVFSTMVSLTAALTIASFNGTHWKIDSQGISTDMDYFENTTCMIQFPQDACMEGLLVMKTCPFISYDKFNDVELSCKSSISDYEVSYYRCSRKRRALESTSSPMRNKIRSHFRSEPMTIIRDLERVIKTFMIAHPFFLGIVMMMLLMLLKANALLTVCVIFSLYAIPAFSYDIMTTQVIQGQGRALVSFTTSSARTTHIILASNITIDFEPYQANISSRVTTRYLYQECKQTASSSKSACGGGTTIIPEPYHGGKKFCENHIVQRGWGSGCGTFSPGTIKTCITVNCSKEATVSKFNSESIIITAAVSIAGESHEITFVNDVHQTLDFGNAGLASIRCKLHEKWTHDYVFIKDSVLGDFLELSEHIVNNWQGPYKIPGGSLMGLDRVLTVTAIDTSEVKYKIAIPQYTTSGLQVSAAGAIVQSLRDR